jgi:hypothetical protein
MKIKISYSMVSPESASQGDFCETGWIDQKGVQFDSVDEALDFLKLEGAVESSSYPARFGDWLMTDFYCVDYRENIEEQKSFHLEGFNADQFETIKKGLGLK